MKTVLVTGANGYIGRHVVLTLLDEGIHPIALDNGANSTHPNAFFSPLNVPYFHGDIADTMVLEDIFKAHPDIESVIHFAGLIYVGQSFDVPHLYYRHNTSSALVFFDFVMRRGVRNIVFSSSAGVYGAAKTPKISEDHPREPINPYGRSKLMTEWILEDLATLYSDINISMLRYFNVAGADAQARTGQNSPKAHHLIEVACEAALGLRNGMSIFGTDYETDDGTCVRDYIHVNDLANAHISALKYNQSRNDSGAIAINCGYGQGLSNLEIIKAVKEISGVDFPVTDAPRRAGDPPSLIAANDKILQTFDWAPKHQNIEKIVSSAFEWKKKMSGL